MIALITGVSRELGLGFSTARLLGEKGVQVIITARDKTKVQALAHILKREGLKVEAFPLDVTSQKSVNDIVRYVDEKYGSIDAIINNAVAGFDFADNAASTDLDTAYIAFETNVIGPWRVNNTFLPLLERSTAPRIVNVSSEAASFGAHGGLQSLHTLGVLSAYSASKSALNAYTIKLAQSLAHTNILVNAVDPGFTATHPELGQQEWARPAAESAKGVVWAATLSQDGPSGGFFRDGERLDW